jgi:hypothetical protein
MSRVKKEYFKICEQDGWEKELTNDPDYELWSIDYSEKSWEEFEKDLNIPNGRLSKTFNEIFRGDNDESK